MKPLMDRITDALQREHDLLLELKELSKEFDNDVERLTALTTRLQVRFEPVTSTGKVVSLPKIEQDEGFSMPNVLKSGPNKRD